MITGPFLGPLIARSTQWLRSTATVLRPRNTTDRLVLGTTDQTGVLSVDAGAANTNAVTTRGYITVDGVQVTANATCIPGILLTESTADFTCAAFLTSASGTLSSVGIYLKNDELTFIFVCGSNGTIRSISIELNGQTCTFTAKAGTP